MFAIVLKHKVIKGNLVKIEKMLTWGYNNGKAQTTLGLLDSGKGTRLVDFLEQFVITALRSRDTLLR